jgi:hypothetical protein
LWGARAHNAPRFSVTDARLALGEDGA